MCKEVCKALFVPYIIGPVEADSQVCRQDESALPVCRDSDELGYGLEIVVIIDSYFKGTWRFFDLTITVTDGLKRRDL